MLLAKRENIRKKPAPDTVIEALRQLNAPKETAVYIGDSDVDVMTAKNCDMPCASVLWGFRDRNELEKFFTRKAFVTSVRNRRMTMNREKDL